MRYALDVTASDTTKKKKNTGMMSLREANGIANATEDTSTGKEITCPEAESTQSVVLTGVYAICTAQE
jgi:hypothetical protein